MHGCTGQAFFGLMVVLCVLTGRDWNGGRNRAADPDHLRRRSAVVLGLVYMQIVLGGWLRHFGSPAALWAHGIFAVAVWPHAVVLTYRIERRRREIAPLLVSSRVLGLTSTVQVLLGLAALAFVLPMGGNPRPVTSYQAVVRTAHQTNAALLVRRGDRADLTQLSSSGRGDASRRRAGRRKTVGRPEAAALDWEAVA